MDSGFIGFNENIKSRLEDVFASSRDIINSIGDDVYELFKHMKFLWSSPNAVLFSNYYNPKVAETLNNAINSVKGLCEKSRNAYNALANACGSAPIAEIDYITGTTIYFTFDTNWPDQGGVVGINRSLKSFADGFETNLTKQLEKFDKIPVELAFYDPEGALAYSYRESWNEIKNTIQTELSDMCRSIRICVNDEIENNDISVEHACEAMKIPNPYRW